MTTKQASEQNTFDYPSGPLTSYALTVAEVTGTAGIDAAREGQIMARYTGLHIIIAAMLGLALPGQWGLIAFAPVVLLIGSAPRYLQHLAAYRAERREALLEFADEHDAEVYEI